MYLKIDLPDRVESNIIACFSITNHFIDAGRNAGGVLVHWYVFCCFLEVPNSAQGRSRSPTLVIAYLMLVKRYNYNQALEVMKKHRPLIDINKGTAYYSILYHRI